MGIKINKKLDIGLDVDGAYGRIDSIYGSKLGLNFTLNYYVSREAFLSGKPYLEQRAYHFVPSVLIGSQNFIKQAYLYTNTLDEFKGAIAVFEEGQA
ncbi:hypothetical protein [Bacillus cereus group sp. IBL03679]|uniref:hypothetical protein n=1 Tax=Bacillus cereus group sp. IBL03679 TaxID=3240095 RepID=UPI003D2F8A8A